MKIIEKRKNSKRKSSKRKTLEYNKEVFFHYTQ